MAAGRRVPILILSPAPPVSNRRTPEMMTLRKSADRGQADHGWLKSFHSFSFADYYDPANMGYGGLRVINEDWIAPGTGFGMHGHKDMEIVTYLLDGELSHRDSMGNGAVIRPGEVQRMSAGTGVMHSEFNRGADRATHLLQIWLQPQRRGVAPSYEQKRFDPAEKRGRLRLVAAPGGENGAVTLHAPDRIYAGLFDGAESFRQDLDPKRLAYVHVVQGQVDVNGTRLEAGDAAKLSGETQLLLDRGRDAEVLVFDLQP
jgi:quercetin 2,3-dioxygenase